MIKDIWIEIRPVLKCCHFCIALKEKINSELKLKIKKSSLIFYLNKNSFNVNFKHFTVDPLTLTSFKSVNQCITFRIQAECDFKFDKHPPLKVFSPPLGNEKFSLLCLCHNPLTSEVFFERILPLPSNDFSFSDMFCHFPTGLQQPSTIPKLNECFYSDNFIVISEKNLTGCRKKGKFFKCNRCLMTVGVHDRHSVKFWFTCIKLPVNNLTPFEHFKHLIQKAISNPVTMFPKILLECEENETYLSLIVVDKNLIVSSCQDDLILKNVEVVKLKYKFHSFCDSEVKLLKEDPLHSLYHEYVHRSMLEFSTKFLVSCSKSIPSIFNRADNECLAYLNL